MLDSEKARAQLRARAADALTIYTLAEILETSPRNIPRWCQHYGLPAPFFAPPDRARYWRPREIIEWLGQRERLAREAVDIEGVGELTGWTAHHWRALVKRKAAPAPAGRALGSTRLLWWRTEVIKSLQTLTGGVRLARRTRRTRRARTDQHREACE